jgi:hypothetical protein
MGAEGIPLASTTARGPVRVPRRTACLVWGRLGEKYRAIDAWGKVVGHAEVKNPASPDPDLGACFYPGLGVTEGRAGVMYVSEGDGWREPASAEWTPTAQDRVAFDRFAATLEDAGPPSVRTAAVRAQKRTPTFFRVGSERHAVFGGRALVVARMDDEGEWRVVRLESSIARMAIDDPYKVIGVFDMNGDGVPEIVFDWQSLDDSGQGVLEQESPRGTWRIVARSGYGTTA